MRRILILAALVCMVMPAMSFGQPKPEGQRPGGDRPGNRGGGEGGGAERGGRMIEMRIRSLHEMVTSLDLSDDQKTKVEGIFTKFKETSKAKIEELQKAEPRERMEGMQGMFEKLQSDIKEVLTEHQREALEKKTAEMRERFRAGGGGGATTRPGAGGGQFPMMERMREAMKQLDLTADQKKKIEDVLTEMKPKFQELRGQAQGNMEQMREKMQPLMQELREKIGQILTDDQKQKLPEIMQGGGGFGGREGRPGQRGRQNTTAPAKGDKGDQATMDSNDMGSDQANAGGSTVAKSGEGGGKSVDVGEPAPNFELKKLDGRNVQLSFFKGRVLVLVFGSYSTPVFRDRAASLEKLAREHRNVEFLLVYTKEAHPKGAKEVDRNKNDEIAIQQPTDEKARMEQAKKAKDALKLTVPIAVDGMDDATSKAYGLMPNGAVIVGRDGKIAFRQKWFEPYSLGMGIEEALKQRS